MIPPLVRSPSVSSGRELTQPGLKKRTTLFMNYPYFREQAGINHTNIWT